MALKYGTSIDLQKNQILNAVLQKLSTDPINPVSGQIYYNTTNNVLRFYNGNGWKNASDMTAADIVIAINGSSHIIDNDNLSSGVNKAIENSHVHANSIVLNNTTASYTTEAEKKVGYLSITKTLDLDALKTAVDTNSGKVSNASHTGDVTGSSELTISANAVTNGKAAKMPANTIKGNNTGASSEQSDLTVSQVRSMLNIADGADVTNATNIGTAIQNAGSKAMIVDADILTILNSEASNVLSKVTYQTIKTALKTYFDNLYNMYTHPTTDGNLHVPATGTTSSGKFLMAGSTPGSLTWGLPTINWDNLNGKPTSSSTDIDAAVAAKHTHTNKNLLDSYKQTEINLADAVNKKHTQNTDIGTNSETFQVGVSGVKIKNSGTELQVRNAADSDFADLRIKNLYIEGETTNVASNTVNIGDNEILLNADIQENIFNSDGGIAIKRLASDNITRKDAKLTYNNSSNRWQSTQGEVSGNLLTSVIANKVTALIGDGSNVSFVITHGLKTRDLTVSIRETNSPYELVLTDIDFTTIDTLTVRFAVPPAVNQYTVTIVG